MKASDVSDEQFLAACWRLWRAKTDEFLAENPGYELGGDYGAYGYHRDLNPVMITRWDVGVELGNPPDKVVLAKARKLIKRGLIVGCACGCRGDFEAVPLSPSPDAAE